MRGTPRCTWILRSAARRARPRDEELRHGNERAQASDGVRPWDGVPGGGRTHDGGVDSGVAPNCKEPDMPLARGRRGHRGVIGGPVARMAEVVGTAAVVKHGDD